MDPGSEGQKKNRVTSVSTGIPSFYNKEIGHYELYASQAT